MLFFGILGMEDARNDGVALGFVIVDEFEVPSFKKGRFRVMTVVPVGIVDIVEIRSHGGVYCRKVFVALWPRSLSMTASLSVVGVAPIHE